MSASIRTSLEVGKNGDMNCNPKKILPAEHCLRESPTTSGQRITAVASSTMFLEAFQNSLGGVRMWSSLKQKFFLNGRLALEGGQPNGSKGKGDGRAK